MRPCPFCGGEPKIFERTSEYGSRILGLAPGCGACQYRLMFSDTFGGDLRGALRECHRLWNHRAENAERWEADEDPTSDL